MELFLYSKESARAKANPNVSGKNARYASAQGLHVAASQGQPPSLGRHQVRHSEKEPANQTCQGKMFSQQEKTAVGS